MDVRRIGFGLVRMGGGGCGVGYCVDQPSRIIIIHRHYHHQQHRRRHHHP